MRKIHQFLGVEENFGPKQLERTNIGNSVKIKDLSSSKFYSPQVLLSPKKAQTEAYGAGFQPL